MNGNLAHFGEDLRLHLFRLQASLDHINGLFARGSIANEIELASRLEELQGATKDTSARGAVLCDALHSGLQRDAALEQETVSRWVATRQTAQLHARADLIEQLATTAAELAALCAVQAERITMTAILARRQAVAVQVQHENHAQAPDLFAHRLLTDGQSQAEGLMGIPRGTNSLLKDV